MPSPKNFFHWLMHYQILKHTWEQKYQVVIILGLSRFWTWSGEVYLKFKILLTRFSSRYIQCKNLLCKSHNFKVSSSATGICEKDCWKISSGTIQLHLISHFTSINSIFPLSHNTYNISIWWIRICKRSETSGGMFLTSFLSRVDLPLLVMC